MNQLEYDCFVQSVNSFFLAEGINTLTPIPYDDIIEPYFSWRACDCCKRSLGGDRYDCNAYNPTTKEIQDGYSVCDDCVYFAEYGELSDTVMMNLEQGKTNDA